jgi:ApeA N-terminal domain 1
MLLPLVTVRDRLQEVMTAWSRLIDRADSALDLLTALTIAPPSYADTQFLFAIQSAEALHRSLFPNKALPPEEFRARRKRVIAAISDDPELVAWVNETMTSNQPRLRQRLAELIEHPGAGTRSCSARTMRGVRLMRGTASRTMARLAAHVPAESQKSDDSCLRPAGWSNAASFESLASTMRPSKNAWAERDGYGNCGCSRPRTVLG